VTLQLWFAWIATLGAMSFAPGRPRLASGFIVNATYPGIVVFMATMFRSCGPKRRSDRSC